MEYGTNLKYIRQINDLTQQQIAQILGIARSTYNQYEQQYNIIPLKILNDFSNYFKVPIDYILGFNQKVEYSTFNPNINAKTIGKRIRILRKKHKLKQYELAKIINIAPSILCEYEKGNYLISTASLYTICKLFNISADYLLNKTPKEDNKVLI